MLRNGDLLHIHRATSAEHHQTPTKDNNKQNTADARHFHNNRRSRETSEPLHTTIPKQMMKTIKR